MGILTRATLVARCNALASGLTKHLPGASLVMASTTYATSQLVTTLTSLGPAVAATATAKAAWQAAVKEEEALVLELLPLVSQVRGTVFQMYRNTVDTLADFGMTPHKKPVESPAVRAAAIAKAKATRAARHTMGKKQRLAVTGATPAPAPAGASGAATITK